MKIQRQKLILKIIEENVVETQDELALFLKQLGMDVTQATVSRDIRDLQLIKVMNEKGIYQYASSAEDTNVLGNRVIGIFQQVVVRIDHAGNMICLHTLKGMANAAAVAIDSLKHNDILGSVAGDDTIFILTKNEDKAMEFTEYFNNILKSKH